MLNQDNSFYLISLSILIACLLDNVWILLWEVARYSHLGVKGLSNAKLEILKITKEQSVTRLIRRTSRPRTDWNTLKKYVDEVHGLKITVQENRFEAEEDEEGILERSAQIEEREGEFEKAELTIKEFRGAEMVEMESAAKEGEERAEKKRKKKFDDEVKVGKAKLE